MHRPGNGLVAAGLDRRADQTAAGEICGADLLRRVDQPGVQHFGATIRIEGVRAVPQLEGGRIVA